MIRRPQIVTALIVMGTLVLAFSTARGAAVRVTVQPVLDTLNVDDEIWLSVHVDSAALRLKTVQLDFSYHGTIIEIVEVVPGSLYATSGHSVFFQNLSVPDTVRAAMSVLGPGVSVDGPGEILAVRVRAKMPGVSRQQVQAPILIDVDGIQLPSDALDGLLVIVTETVDVDGFDPDLWLRTLQNPARHEAVLDYGSNGAGAVELSWYDVRGRRRGAMALSPSKGRVRLRLAEAGVYWLVIRQDGLVKKERIIWAP